MILKEGGSVQKQVWGMYVWAFSESNIYLYDNGQAQHSPVK